MLTDRFRLDPLTSRLLVSRTIVRDGRARQVPFVVRLFGFPELRHWLIDAGFIEVSAFGEDGEPLRADHDGMIVTGALKNSS